jgi:hypothetical protein
MEEIEVIIGMKPTRVFPKDEEKRKTTHERRFTQIGV